MGPAKQPSKQRKRSKTSYVSETGSESRGRSRGKTLSFCSLASIERHKLSSKVHEIFFSSFRATWGPQSPFSVSSLLALHWRDEIVGPPRLPPKRKDEQEEEAPILLRRGVKGWRRRDPSPSPVPSRAAVSSSSSSSKEGSLSWDERGEGREKEARPHILILPPSFIARSSSGSLFSLPPPSLLRLQSVLG